MPGYALLPTLDNPKSTLSYRLTSEEKKERDAWIVGALAHGLTFDEIADEVGLSLGYLKTLVRKLTKDERPKRPQSKFGSPKEAALWVFWTEEAHPRCNKNPMGMCDHCFGTTMLIELEYDETGWPHSWAMHEQEKFIAMSRPRTEVA